MSDLKVITQKSSEIESALIDGRDDVQLEVDLNNIESVEIYNGVTQRLEHFTGYYKELAKRYSDIAKKMESVANRNHEFLKKIMVETNQMEVNGTSFRFKLSPLKPKLVVDDEDVLKSQYSKTETKVVVDKERAKQDLELGVPVEGAHLEPVYALKTYPLKAVK